MHAQDGRTIESTSLPGQHTSNPLALIIPTRNRKSLLSLLLLTIDRQTRKPDQTIIVDGSDEPIEEWLRSRNHSFRIDYVRVYPPSLTKQRNAGIAALGQEIALVSYLDDDIELEPDAVEKMLEFFGKHGANVGGASFNITNNPRQRVTFPQRLFLMRSLRQGVILKSGFTTIAYPDGQHLKTEWLCGGATVWRRAIVDSQKYDEWFAGTAYFEDVDFSYRAAKSSQLFVVHDAKVTHNPPPFAPQKAVKLGEMEVTYRYYFVKKFFPSHIADFYWSTIGQFLANAATAVLDRSVMSLNRCKGNLIGAAKIALGRIDKVETAFRQDASTPDHKQPGDRR